MIMKKDVQLKFALLLMLFVASFAACDDDDEKIDAGSPDFTFNSETGEYNVRIGKEVALCAHPCGFRPAPQDRRQRHRQRPGPAQGRRDRRH